MWEIEVAIPYNTGKLLEKLGYGLRLGLNSMQGREAKHIELELYVQNASNDCEKEPKVVDCLPT